MSGLLVFLAGCADAWLGDELENSPTAVFDEVWSQIDRHYSHFTIKEADWKALYQQYRPQITETMTERKLFEVMCEMIDHLEDGHVNIVTSFGGCGYSAWFTQYPRNYSSDLIERYYLPGRFGKAADDRITYGMIDKEIGYIHINSFSGSGWADSIDIALGALDGAAALVVDVRNNGGGSGRIAEQIAGRFADTERLYAYYRYRNGPNYSDFTQTWELRVRPMGEAPFRGPVALLTNRSCFSACEHFTLAMDELPNVTVLGDTTGGGLGNPIYRELPNGWAYRFPVWLETNVHGASLEGIGIGPDILVNMTQSDAVRGRDTILEAALGRLRSAN